MARQNDGMRPFERSLPMALMNAREAVMMGFRKILGEHGVNEQQWRVIRALVETDQLEIGVLAVRINLLGPSLTRILQNLGQRGLVTRNPVEGDQRRRVVALTPKGRELFDRVSPRSEAEYRRIESLIGPEKLEELYRVLEHTRRTLRDDRADDPHER